MKYRTPRKKCSPGPGRNHPQVEASLLPQLEILHVLLGGQGQALDPFGGVIEALAGLGEPDLPAAPFQETDSALGFQPLELEGDRGLGQVQAPGPGGDGAFFHHGNETVQLFQIHIPSCHIENI